MSQQQKLRRRFLTKPTDFTWDELKSLLGGFGYQEMAGGKTGGSRRRFVHPDREPIILHKPHPGKLLKSYPVAQLVMHLQFEGLL